MSNLLFGAHDREIFGMNGDIQVILLVVTSFAHGGDATFTIEAEALPSVEEVIPRNLDAKLDL